MSESIEITIEARGREFDVDIAGLQGPDDLDALVKDAWNDIWIGEEPGPNDDDSALGEGDWVVVADTWEAEYSWLFYTTVIDWEWGWIEFLSYDCNVGIDVAHAAWSCDITSEEVEEAYEGEWGSDVGFVEELCMGICTGLDDLPCYIYIDWERTARDIMMDYTEHNGYYFRCL